MRFGTIPMLTIFTEIDVFQKIGNHQYQPVEPVPGIDQWLLVQLECIDTVVSASQCTYIFWFCAGIVWYQSYHPVSAFFETMNGSIKS